MAGEVQIAASCVWEMMEGASQLGNVCCNPENHSYVEMSLVTRTCNAKAQWAGKEIFLQFYSWASLFFIGDILHL